MRQPSARIIGIGVAAGVAALVAGCADEPTRATASAAARDVNMSFAMSAEERGQLGAALAFARESAIRGLQRPDAGDRVAAAFATLAERVEADDRAGATRALAAARTAVQQYREHAGSDVGAADADLEAMTLTLDRATALVQEGATSTSTTTSRWERQP
jgi:hypothetical protein